MKNYKNFLLEKITKEDLININDIVKIQVIKHNKIQKMYYNNTLQDEIFLTDDTELKDFDLIKIETLPYTRSNTFVIMYCYYNKEPKILKISIKSFKIFAEKLEIREKQKNEVRGHKIETFQFLGLLYDKRENDNLIFPEENDILKKEDFNFNIFNKNENDDIYKYFINNELIYDEEDFKLLFGSIKFKDFMEHRHLFNKNRNPFEFNKVIHRDKKIFLNSLLEKEKEIVNFFDLELNTDKGNTTDIIVSDDLDIMNEISKKDNFVVSEISRRFEMNVEFKKANSNDTKKIDVFEGGVCYLFNKDLLKIEDLQNATNKEMWIKNLIKKYGKDKPKFIQISLKKSKTGAQFGKVTKTIINQFLDDNNDINENFGNFFRKVNHFFNKIFNKIKSFFSKLNIEKDNIIEKDTNKIINDFVYQLNNNFIYENKDFFDYKPEKIETELIGNLFVFNDKPEEIKNEIENLENKKYASSKIDFFIKNLRKTSFRLKTEPKKLHEKFAEILTVSLMGSTNLPLYMVFGTKNKKDLSFTLHTYRTDKKQKHIEESLKNDIKTPMYIAYIRNHTKNNKILYKTLKMLIFNYSSITNKYISIDLRTNSSSHRSFVAETTVPTKNVINKVTDAYYKFINK